MIVLVATVCGCAEHGLREGEGWFARGLEAYRRGAWNEAFGMFTRSIDEYPQHAPSYYYRGLCRLKRLKEKEGTFLEETEAAHADLSEAIAWSGDPSRAYFARAMASAVVGRYKESVQDLLVCTGAASPPDVRRKAHLMLATIYDEKFEDAEGEAIRHYESYVGLGGADPQAAARLAELRRSFSGSSEREPK